MNTPTIDAPIDSNIDYHIMRDILHVNYLGEKHQKLSEIIGKEETKTIWFDINNIRDFLTNILGDGAVTGIRVYLCGYGDEVISHPHGNIPHDDSFVNQLTIGFVATRQVGGRHLDYHTSESKQSLLVAPPQNHGELCPTKCV
jgi:hypothetical protein